MKHKYGRLFPFVYYGPHGWEKMVHVLGGIMSYT